MDIIKIKKEEKRSLIFYIRYNEDREMQEVIVINKWYWIGANQLRQMSDHIVSFVENALDAKEYQPCIYFTLMSAEQIKEILESEGLHENNTLSRIRIE